VTPNLTEPNKELAEQVRNTIPGMAHWAGTGPKGSTCGTCKNLVDIQWGVGRTTRCQKYYSMMNKKWGPKKIDPQTPSCKYYEDKTKKITVIKNATWNSWDCP